MYGSRLTSRDAVHLVLNEEVDQGQKSAEKSAGKILSQLDGPWVWGAQGETSKGPGDGCD